MKSLSVALVVTLAGAAACGGKVTPAPPPFRPTEVVVEKPKPPPDPTSLDCEALNPLDAKPALTFLQRSIPESDRLATEGLTNLKAAESTAAGKIERERLITEAVSKFLDALLADPYNVNATYNLAAAYARIGRTQCSLNLLERLLQMRTHPSKQDDVERKLDRLLGRKKQALDPDFEAMRSDPRFRELIRDMCAGTEDPGCVRGR